jgi:uncharacterized protein (TIGR02145 family)
MRKVISSFILFLVVFSSKGQNVGIGTATPHPSAALDISSSTSGFLPPRMTNTERNGINNPTAGLMIYNTTTDCLEIFGKGKWNPVYCVPADTTAGNDSTMVTDIDGNTYPTVKICDQTWMAKNLDVARYRNGDPIPQVTDHSQWLNLTTGAWCWYNNDSATYGSVYGRLYNWYAVNDPRGLAPEGWHIPSDGEWTTLTECLGGDSIAGGKMKEVGTSHWNSPNTGATNISGFSALPGGYVNINQFQFSGLGEDGEWWSSSEFSNTKAWYRFIYNTTSNLNKGADWVMKTYGFSVRCVKDVPPPSTLDSGLVAFYPFSGNAGDSSGNGNHGTVNGATLTTDRFGNTGKAYSFNGNIDNISIPHSNSLAIEGNITMSVWKKSLGNTGNYETFLSKRDGNGNWNYSLGASHYYGPGGCPGEVNKYVTARRNNGGAEYELKYSDTLVSTSVNVWTNVIVVINNNIVKFYVNGVQTGYSCFGDTFSISAIDTGAPLTIGSCNCGLAEYFNGSLDDIRIYNRVLTQAEITYLATH